MPSFNITIRGLEKAKLIPSTIERKLAEFRLELLPPLVEDFRRTEPADGRWPKSRRRKTIQQQTKGFIRGETVVVGTFHSRYARSLDTGGIVKPRPGKVLRFRNEEGEFVFTRKPIVHKRRPYFGRVLSQVPSIVSRVYDRVFADVTHGD
jgi:hypothetical protein